MQETKKGEDAATAEALVGTLQFLPCIACLCSIHPYKLIPILNAGGLQHYKGVQGGQKGPYSTEAWLHAHSMGCILAVVVVIPIQE